MSDSGKHGQNVIIKLPRVCLTGNGECLFKSHFFRDQCFELLDLIVIAAEQLKEACTCSCRSFATEKPERFFCIFNGFDVEQQILKPKSCALSDGRRLCGLKMSIRKRRLGSVLFRKRRGGSSRVYEQLLYARKGVAHLNYIGIVSNVAGCSTEMDYRFCLRTNVAVGVNVSHYIMSEAVLVSVCRFVVDIVYVLLHFGDLFFGDIESEFHFGFRESYPELSPCGEFYVR